MEAFKPKILVVEDDTAMLRLLGRVLSEMGAEPHLVSSSPHAAELVEGDKFDGVVLDWRMPEMDGLELARRIRRSKSNARVPLVMLTGVDKHSAMEECFSVGIDFFLQKPVTVEKLRHLLNASRGLMLEERRQYQRAPVAIGMRLRWEGGQCVGQTINLSSSGALLAMEEPPPVGTEMRLEFELPGDPTPFHLAATVVRLTRGAAPTTTEGRGCAVRFDHQSRGDRLRLTEFADKALASLSSTL